MSDGLEDQIAAIEAANTHEGDQMEPGAGDAAKPDSSDTEGQPKAEAEAKQPLELTEGDEAVDVEDGEDGGEEHEDGEGKKRRSKPASQRIAELTAKLRAAERELEAARNPAPESEAKEPPARPDPSAFEYGEADPAYIDAMVDWKLETREAERNRTSDEQREQDALRNRLEAGVAKAQAEAQEKYEDFDAKIAEAVEARGGEPLPPLLSVAIGVSPAGGDIIYRLASDPDASDRLEELARGGMATAPKLAMAFGELEGEYLADGDDSDLDMTDQLDMARMMGRMRARLAGRTAAPAKTTVREIPETRAPAPPEKRARGGAGTVKVTPDTDDMRAFMKEYGSGLGT